MHNPVPAEPDVTVYKMGLVYASVCAKKALTKSEVDEAMNRMEPSGIDSAWQVAGEPFRTGEPNPCPCNQDPSRLHYLLVC